MTDKKRVELYRRLPEIYRIKDEELSKAYLYNGKPAPADQLQKYLAPIEDMFSAIHENIESLYHDLFIETCDDWVIPYIGDLLGTSHLSGDEWTLRADVADTIALRRRKGTLSAIELLAFILTKWGVHSVELLECMVWNQHLNHQRPDEGGDPPYSLPTVNRSTPIRGGTVSLRDPSLLAQLNTPFDPFAHVADVKPHEIGQVRYNLPNLAIYLWRLEDYRIKAAKPLMRRVNPAGAGAKSVVRVNVDPIPTNKLSRPYVKTIPTFTQDNRPGGRPVRLFNTNHFDLFNGARSGIDALDLSAIAPRISNPDNVPGPIPVERISDYDFADAYDASLGSTLPQSFEFFAEASFTAPQEYLSIESYDETAVDLSTLDISDVGLQLHLPNTTFPNESWPHKELPRFWKIRGENLCAWEAGLNPPLADREIAIDPARGRIAIGVLDDTHADALVDKLLVTFTYGAAGPVGAHPVSYPALPEKYDHDQNPAVNYIEVNYLKDKSGLQKALQNIAAETTATVIEIVDSRTHKLDISTLPGADIVIEKGIASLKLNAPLFIRAADGERPVIELAQPLAFRPVKVVGADAAEQAQLDEQIDELFVHLEGLFIARGLDYADKLPLIARAAIGRIEILNCTLDPGGFRRHITEPGLERAPRLPAVNLKEPYGFAKAADEQAFKQTPEINIQRSICGAVFTDEGYRLCISDSIVEAVIVSVPQSAGPAKDFPFAITGATDPAKGYAGAAVIQNVTILGRVRVSSIEGGGGIFTGVLEVFDQQTGCLKFCYFADDSASPAPPDAVKNKLPQNFECVFGDAAKLIFSSEFFGDPDYCQLSLECDPDILENGPGMDQMGAFNFMLEAHRWRNLRIRFREFMPVGIRPLLIPVT